MRGKYPLIYFACCLCIENGHKKNKVKDYFDVNVLNIDAYNFTRGNTISLCIPPFGLIFY